MKAQVYQAIARSLGAYTRCAKETNHPWTEKHKDNIERIIKDNLPHGSGFDNGTTLDFDKSTDNKLVFNTAFHHMDDNGFYCGWTNHTVTVLPELSFGFSLKISGANTRGIKEYIDEEFRYCLSLEIEPYKKEN